MAIMSTRRYFLLSALAAAAVVWHAFATREQFFPSMVYLSSSKISLAVLGNMGFALALASYKVLLRVFLGRLRDSELERVNDKVGQAVVETCLAMTIFREDFTATFLSMFVILSFVKIFHWLVQDRVDFIETTPNVSRLQHFRIATFTLVLLAIDIAFLKFSLHETLNSKSAHGGVSVFLLFAFEYTVQASTIVLTFVKYCLSMVDMAMEGRWEGKGVAVFYLELTLDMLHLLVYCAFFAVIFSTYGIPLHLVRDLYWTFRNFQTRVRDFLRYRRITANMDQSFPDATEEDLQRADHTCIICREEMTAAGHNKKLGCSHCFHLHCLRSWLERQQNCPICRRSVMPPAPPAAAAAAAPQAAAAAGAGAAPGGAGDAAAAELAAAAERVRAAAAQGMAAGAGAPPAMPPPGVAGGFGGFAPPPAAEQPAHPRRRRGWRVHLFGGDGGEAAAAGAAPAHVFGPAGLEGGWPMMAPYPQWVPAAPMAVFMPAGGLPQIQYAGQQHPEQVMAAAQQQAAAAAAAAAAASMMPLMMPLQPFMMPPIMAPAGTAGASTTQQQQQQQQQHPTMQQHLAAVAAAATATASLLGPIGGGAASAAGATGLPVGVGGGAAGAASDAVAAAATAAAAGAMQKVLRQQLAALQLMVDLQAQQAQQAQQGMGPTAPAAAAAAAPAPAPSPAAPASSAAPAAPAATQAEAGSSSSSATMATTAAAVAPTTAAQNAAPAAQNATPAASAGVAGIGAGAGQGQGEAPQAQHAQQAPQAQQAQREEDSEAEALRRRRLERFGASP